VDDEENKPSNEKVMREPKGLEVGSAHALHRARVYQDHRHHRQMPCQVSFRASIGGGGGGCEVWPGPTADV